MLNIQRRRPGSFHHEALVASGVVLSTSGTYARSSQEDSLLQAGQSGCRTASSTPDMAGQADLQNFTNLHFYVSHIFNVTGRVNRSLVSFCKTRENKSFVQTIKVMTKHDVHEQYEKAGAKEFRCNHCRGVQKTADIGRSIRHTATCAQVAEAIQKNAACKYCCKPQADP